MRDSLLAKIRRAEAVDGDRIHGRATLRGRGSGRYHFGVRKDTLRAIDYLVPDGDGGEQLVAESVVADPDLLVLPDEVVIAYRLPRVDALRAQHGDVPDAISLRDLDRRRAPTAD